MLPLDPKPTHTEFAEQSESPKLSWSTHPLCPFKEYQMSIYVVLFAWILSVQNIFFLNKYLNISHPLRLGMEDTNWTIFRGANLHWEWSQFPKYG